MQDTPRLFTENEFYERESNITSVFDYYYWGIALGVLPLFLYCFGSIALFVEVLPLFLAVFSRNGGKNDNSI